MSDLTIRPTAKYVKAGAILAAVAVAGLEIMCWVSWNQAAGGAWIMALPPLILLWPAWRAMKRTFVKTTITGDRLRYEVGMAAKSTRTIQLSKVQDVRVDQRLAQRLWKVGDLSIETAGETSRLVLHDVDNPQPLADEIMNRAQQGAGTA